MSVKNYVLKGDICYCQESGALETMEKGWLVCREGKCAGVFQALPKEYEGYPLTDCGDMLILPGLVDLHIHAPQYAFRGLGMDLELLDWLNTHAFSEEAKYQEASYAKKAYAIFAAAMKRSATTRACIFATIHNPATLILMDLMEETGLKTMVGKVNMDRNSPRELCEEGAKRSAHDTVEWLKAAAGRYENVRPVLTPRFIPSCTDELMGLLKKIQVEYGLPLQSHLSENQGEIVWVQELCPKSEFYGDAYDRFGLFGGSVPTIMAHCVFSSEEEVALMKKRGVYVAHCPESNMNLSSGVAPIREYLDKGLRMGLGSDVAGGTGESIFRAMAHAIQASKLRWRLEDQDLKPLTLTEAFYLGTLGGGSFFGRVGSFLKGYEFDALILDDASIPHPGVLTIKERLERVIYLSDDRHLRGKFVAGRRIL